MDLLSVKDKLLAGVGVTNVEVELVLDELLALCHGTSARFQEAWDGRRGARVVIIGACPARGPCPTIEGRPTHEGRCSVLGEGYAEVW